MSDKELIKINTKSQSTALLTCRIPLMLRAEITQRAAEMGYNNSQFFALVLDKVKDRETLDNLMSGKLASLEKVVLEEGKDISEEIDALKSKIKHLEERLQKANDYIANETILGKPKKF